MVCMTDDVGDEELMYEPLLDNIGEETLMNEDNFEIDTGSCNRLQGLKQEDLTLKDGRNLEAWERPGTSGEEQVDERSRHERAIVRTTKEATVFDCNHVVIDSTSVG